MWNVVQVVSGEASVEGGRVWSESPRVASGRSTLTNETTQIVGSSEVTCDPETKWRH